MILGTANRARLGFPEWNRVWGWLNDELSAVYPPALDVEIPEIKKPEVPELPSYEEVADDCFWDCFPKRDLPDRVSTKVNVTAIRRRVIGKKNKMARTEFIRAKRVLRDLQHGAEAFQKSELLPISTRNSKSAVVHGRLLTDTIAS